MSKPETTFEAFEQLQAATQRLWVSILKEVRSFIDETIPPEQDDDSPDRSDQPRPVGRTDGLVRTRGRCDDKFGTCNQGAHHYHYVLVPGLGQPEQPPRTSEVEGGGDKIFSARGEPCPAYPQCRCSCEHYHRSGETNKPHSRNESAFVGAANFFTCPIHGRRIYNVVL